MLDEVGVVCLPGPSDRPSTRSLLRHTAHRFLVEDLGATRTGRLCPRCGSAAHGRPWIRVAEGPAPSVSLAYADDLVLVAWSWAGGVGVDVTRVDSDAGVYGDALAWTRAEAALKATGEALARDPLDLPDDVRTEVFELPGLVGHLAVQVSPVSAVSPTEQAARAARDAGARPRTGRRGPRRWP